MFFVFVFLVIGSVCSRLLPIIHEKVYFVQQQGEHFMREFWIRLGSVQDVQEFVSIAATRTYPVIVRDKFNKINADSFMELFCLDFTHPLRVVCNCSEQELDQLKQNLHRFLAE